MGVVAQLAEGILYRGKLIESHRKAHHHLRRMVKVLLHLFYSLYLLRLQVSFQMLHTVEFL